MQEQETSRQRTALTGIFINLEARSIEFEDAHGTVGRLVLTEAVVLYEGVPLPWTTPETAARDRRPPSASTPPRPPDYRGPRDP